MVYFLDLAVEEAMKRGDFGDERYEREAMQRAVRENFHALRQETWKLVDARGSVDDVHAFLYADAKRVLEEVHSGGAPVRTLTWTAPATQVLAEATDLPADPL